MLRVPRPTSRAKGPTLAPLPWRTRLPYACCTFLAAAGHDCQDIEKIGRAGEAARKLKTQDGCKLRRYERRWKIVRLFAWLGNFRRLVGRHERRADNFLGFVNLGCIVILLGRSAGLV